MGKSVYVSIGGKYCVNPTNDLIRDLKSIGIKINGFELKAGRNPGYGYLLMIKEDLPSIIQSGALTLKISDGNETVEIDRIIIVDTWANHPKLTDQSLILVKIADSRHLAIQMPSKVGFPPFPAHASLGPQPGAATSWDNGIESYWNTSNTLTLYSSVTKTQADFPTVLLRDVHYDVAGIDDKDDAWRKLNDILDLCCHQVYKDYIGYSIRAVKNIPVTNTNLDSSIDTLAISKRHDLTDERTERPHYTNHLFRKCEKDFTFEKYRSDPWHIITNATTSNNYFSNTYLTIPVYNLYIPDDQNSATYLTDLQNLAQKLSQLYYDAYDAHKLLDAEYFGVHKFIPSGSAVSIEFYHDEVGYVTKVRSINMGEWVFPKVPVLYYPFEKQYMIQGPAGGIPPRYLNKLGKATCTVVKQNQDAVPNNADDDFIFIPVNPDQIVVYNWTSAPACATGSRYGIASWVNDNFYIIAEDCGDEGDVAAPLSINSTFGDFASPIETVSGGLTTSQTFSYIGTVTGTGTGGT